MRGTEDISSLTLNPDSGIKVLDRAILILRTATARPANLSELCEATQLPRATAHRLATALEAHRLLARNAEGRWGPGSGLSELSPGSTDRIIQVGTPIMRSLMNATGESVQIYRLTGDVRTCIASIEPPTGLRNTVPVGARMSLLGGSAAQILVALSPGLDPAAREAILREASYSPADIEKVRRTDIAESVGERDTALASVAVPIRDRHGVVAALSISGPVERMKPSPIALYGEMIQKACAEMNEALM